MRAVIRDPEKTSSGRQKSHHRGDQSRQTITGMLKLNDNFSLSLQTLDGSFHFLKKSDLSSVDFGSRSLMPPSSGLSSKELDDLVSYLIQAGVDSAKNSGTHASASDDDDN